MLQIYLIRHGQTKWNLLKKMQGSKDSKLTDQGIKQAIMLGKKLKPVKFNKIYSSSATRTMETSGFIFPSMEVCYSTSLNEIAMGEWEGRTYTQIEKMNPKEWHNFFNDPFNYNPSKGGESFAKLKNRLKQFIYTERLFSQEGNIAIVSHRITLRMLLSILLEEKELFSEIDLSPTSLSVIEIDDNTCKVKYLNNISHYCDA
ncbi:histidine phosphatase family protein [Desulfitobacterium chlororespirans]|uniref:Probable phosphoglycerate mutase n=1 Tax=Desulfitobacterium chlororespirans DSM 11544 TaxID=1121395 RepID=A0A1M7UVK8_9FIRM|nr:histidine phosphatase family protein [Desulfitobacterium chlororespirans]SHN86936.1 probable phosphoglycerate mutase [Desulfitobacterium chlororespirans DSM 11544]